jgi:methionine salvage enolase-phosphatase E1
VTLIEAIEGFAPPISVVVKLGLFAYAQIATLRSTRKQARDPAISDVLAALETVKRRRTCP